MTFYKVINNVFPFMVEGTMAGIAAGIIALDTFSFDQITPRAPQLEIRQSSEMVDIAFVDVVVSNAVFIGSRAVWDISTLQEIFLARAQPGNIGFSSVGGHLYALEPSSGRGMHIKIGPGEQKVKVPIAPGLIRTVPIESFEVFKPGHAIPISHTPAVIAMDGERELIAKKGDALTIQINANGPWVVDIAETLRKVSQESLFLEE